MPGSHVLGMYTLSSAVQGYQQCVAGNCGWVWVLGLGLDMTAANRVHVTKVDNSGQQSEQGRVR